jgi:hypothetical protein
MAASSVFNPHSERLEPRVSSALYLPVYPRGVRDRPFGHLADASLGGIRLLAPTPGVISERLELDVCVFARDAEAWLPVAVRVRWSLPSANPALYEIGAQYLAVLPADAAALLEHLRAYSEWL